MHRSQAEAFQRYMVSGTPHLLDPLPKVAKPFPRRVQEMGTMAWIHLLLLVYFDPQKCLKSERRNTVDGQPYRKMPVISCHSMTVSWDIEERYVHINIYF